MGNSFFVIKTFIVTIAIVMLMQIKIGQNTIEESTMAWIEQSSILAPLQKIAVGGAKIAQDGWHKISQAFSEKKAKGGQGAKPGVEGSSESRSDLKLPFMKFRRSSEYERDKATRDVKE